MGVLACLAALSSRLFSMNVLSSRVWNNATLVRMLEQVARQSFTRRELLLEVLDNVKKNKKAIKVGILLIEDYWTTFLKIFSYDDLRELFIESGLHKYYDGYLAPDIASVIVQIKNAAIKEVGIFSRIIQSLEALIKHNLFLKKSTGEGEEEIYYKKFFLSTFLEELALLKITFKSLYGMVNEKKSDKEVDVIKEGYSIYKQIAQNLTCSDCGKKKELLQQVLYEFLSKIIPIMRYLVMIDQIEFNNQEILLKNNYLLEPNAKFLVYTIAQDVESLVKMMITIFSFEDIAKLKGNDDSSQFLEIKEMISLLTMEHKNSTVVNLGTFVLIIFLHKTIPFCKSEEIKHLLQIILKCLSLSLQFFLQQKPILFNAFMEVDKLLLQAIQLDIVQNSLRTGWLEKNSHYDKEVDMLMSKLKNFYLSETSSLCAAFNKCALK